MRTVRFGVKCWVKVAGISETLKIAGARWCVCALNGSEPVQQAQNLIKFRILDEQRLKTL